MQATQLKEGEFCPPDYPTVICKAGPRVVWVGLHQSGFTGLCSVTMRKGEAPLAAATRKLNELKDNSSLSDVPDDYSDRQGAEQQPAATDDQQPAATDEQQPAATEVLGRQGRPEREVRAPDFLQPCEDLRQFATGSRKRRRDPDDERCTKRACECASVRAERDEYKQRCKEQAAAHLRLREKVSAIAHDVAGGDGSIGTAASAMQQALLELLDLQEGVELSGDESEGEESEDGSSQDEDASDDDDAARSRLLTVPVTPTPTPTLILTLTPTLTAGVGDRPDGGAGRPHGGRGRARGGRAAPRLERPQRG